MATSMWNGLYDTGYFSNNLPPAMDIAMEMTGSATQWSSADMDFLMEVNDKPEITQNAFKTNKPTENPDTYSNNSNVNNEQCIGKEGHVNMGIESTIKEEDAVFISRSDLVNSGGGLCVKSALENSTGYVPTFNPPVTAVNIGGTSYYLPYTDIPFDACTYYQQPFLEMPPASQFPYVQNNNTYVPTGIYTDPYNYTYMTCEAMFTNQPETYQYQPDLNPFQSDQFVVWNQDSCDMTFQNSQQLEQPNTHKATNTDNEKETKVSMNYENKNTQNHSNTCSGTVKDGSLLETRSNCNASEQDKNDFTAPVVDNSQDDKLGSVPVPDKPVIEHFPDQKDKTQDPICSSTSNALNKVQSIGLPVPFNPLVPPPPIKPLTPNQQPEKLLLYDQKNKNSKHKNVAEAVTPSGYKFYIPLDDRRYALKKSRHDLYDIPDRCSFHVFDTEGQFESCVLLDRSPRPVQYKGSLSEDEDASESEESDLSRQTSAKLSESIERVLTQAGSDKTICTEVTESEKNETNNTEGGVNKECETVEMKYCDTQSEHENVISTGKDNANNIDDRQSCGNELSEDISMGKLGMECAPETILHEEVIINEPMFLNIEQADHFESYTLDPGCINPTAMEIENGELAGYRPYPQQWHQMPFEIPIVNQQQVFSPHLSDQNQLTIAQDPSMFQDSIQTWQPQIIAEPFIITESVSVALPEDSNSDSKSNDLGICIPPDLIDPSDGLPYPALHVTEDGLITVILRHGVYVEMTPDKAVRLVNHELKLVAAFSETGSKTCVIHPAARIYQSETTIDVELTLNRKAKMTSSNIIFGNGTKTYKFDYRMINEAMDFNNFRVMTEDPSVSFLETTTGFLSTDVALRCSEMLGRAYFEKQGEKGCKVIINGSKIVQSDNGDVTVYSGSIRYLRMCPATNVIRVRTQFVEIDIERNWNLKIQRGTHTLNSSHPGFILSNGKIKASLDQRNKMDAFSLPNYKRLTLGQSFLPRRSGPGPRRRFPKSNTRYEPENDHRAYTRH